MKLLNTLTLATLGFVSASALAAPFACPSEKDFLSSWSGAVAKATAEDSKDALASDRALAFDFYFPSNIPNHDLKFNAVEIAGVSYDLTLVADDFLWNPDYPDAYGVLFQEGTSIVVGVLKSDTDRSDFECKALFAPTLVLPSSEFLSLTIDSPQGVPAEIQGVRYEKFFVVSDHLAFGETAQGDFVQFVPAE